MPPRAPRSLIIIAVAVFASAGLAEGDPASSATASAQGSQGFIVAVPQGTDPAAASRFAAEPQQLPPTEVTAPRDDRGPCDPRAGTGQEACRAKLAAKYAEMDKLCRIVSTGSEVPVCVKSAYAAD